MLSEVYIYSILHFTLYDTVETRLKLEGGQLKWLKACVYQFVEFQFILHFFILVSYIVC